LPGRTSDEARKALAKSEIASAKAILAKADPHPNRSRVEQFLVEPVTPPGKRSSSGNLSDDIR
jgi:hypothetical protein